MYVFFCVSDTLKKLSEKITPIITLSEVSGSKLDLFVLLGGQNWKFSLLTFKNSRGKHKK